MNHLDAQASHAGGLILLAIIVLVVITYTRRLCSLPDEHLVQRWGGRALRKFPRVLRVEGRTVADVVTNKLGVSATILGAITSAGFIGFSVMAATIDRTLWNTLSQEDLFRLIIVPTSGVRGLLMLGGAGLLFCGVLVAAPRSWHKIREVVATAILLAILYQSISFWMVIEQLDAAAQLNLLDTN